MDRINLNVGYSGACIRPPLISVTGHRRTRLGLPAMCIGTGQDIATIIRRAWVQIEK